MSTLDEVPTRRGYCASAALGFLSPVTVCFPFPLLASLTRRYALLRPIKRPSCRYAQRCLREVTTVPYVTRRSARS